MRVAVIGRGNIGGTLGAAFARGGHSVRYGMRNPGDAADEATVADALQDCDAVLLALPAAGVDDLLAEHGPKLAGRLVIDATNNIGGPVANAAAQIRAAVPGARYARAFNTLGWENFADPDFDGTRADAFYSCASDDRPDMDELISAVGLRPMWVGADKEAQVDALLGLWFSLVQTHGGNRRLAFRVLERGQG